MLAPMAGVTDVPFRRLCRNMAEKALTELGKDTVGHPRYAPAGLFVTEMVTARALLEDNAETLRMVQPDPQEPVHSVQIYGVEPKTTAGAAAKLVSLGLADHIDLNFGCPVPKVTRKGGGSALPWKTPLMVDLLQRTRTVIDREDPTVPLTLKVRLGIDDGHQTWRDSLQIATDAGCAAITLHARTTAQYYSGRARWEKIAELVRAAQIPVFGNGDIFSGEDARNMIAQTACAGVVVGRGAQGRPWIFADLVHALSGSNVTATPTLCEVANIVVSHAELMANWLADEARAMREMRKHIGWYLRGFSVGGQTRRALGLVKTLEELRTFLGALDLDQKYPPAAGGSRGRTGRAKTPHLPHGWLDSRELSAADLQMLASASAYGGDGG